MAKPDHDTIVAIASAPGNGGIGIVRLSGAAALSIARQMVAGETLSPRYATYTHIYKNHNELIDRGIVLYFQAPHSFTGEDVVELQCHGGTVVLDMIVETTTALGARIARPGEFSERAFLNNKLDLAQAEAIADLINADTRAAAQAALRSMNGLFSKEVDRLVHELISLRAYIEAAIDFPEEEVDFLSDASIKNRLIELHKSTIRVFDSSKTGVLLNEGLRVVIAGKPNAGKSSLLNALAARDVAIVTPVAGTTRDVLREKIQIDGIPLHIIDTAGLRESDDIIEQEGIRRAKQELTSAQIVLLVVDSTEPRDRPTGLPSDLPEGVPVLTVLNKADLSGDIDDPKNCCIAVSAKTGEGLDRLRQHLKLLAGAQSIDGSVYSARRRHLDSLEKAGAQIKHGLDVLNQERAGELLAEDLRLAQQALESITGRFLPDDLLEKIFRDFCIGK